MVPPASHRISRVPWYSGSSYLVAPVPYRIVTVSDAAFQQLRGGFELASGVLQPRPGQSQIGLGYLPFRSPLLWESRLISFRRATEMFQFAHCPPLSLYIQERVSRHHSGWVAPFGFSRLIAWMQLPLNVSSVSTSFIGLTRLGIHLVLFLACGPRVWPTSRRFSRVVLASASLLFALGKIEVSIQLFSCQCAPFLVLGYYAILWQSCQAFL